jgi:hypothetical protein
MLSIEDFHSLEKGDVVEPGPVFAGLSNVSAKFEVVAISNDGTLKEFDATYLGVSLGRYGAHLTDKDGAKLIEWLEVRP